MALASYRHVLRAISIAFRGDVTMLNGARAQARQTYEQNRTGDASSTAAQVQHAEDVAKILLENVVQGRQEGEKPDQYKLRIHEHTERGDNETIKTGGACGSAAR